MNTPQKKKQDKYGSWIYNVRDKYKPLSTEEIKSDLDKTRLPLAICMAQIEGDFNMGCIVRSANNFNLSQVFYYGKKHWDRRSAIATYHYIDVKYLRTNEDILALKKDYHFVALENNTERKITPIQEYSWKKNSLIFVGEEGKGIISEILDICDDYVEIPSMGSVRSLNAAVAASISIYDYVSKYK